MPEISIIVPVYKVEKYLNTCVDSLLSQTFANFELILVDDGSPDRCPEICDEYAKKDVRIKVIHKKNGGLSDARNAGIQAALGKYVCFIDSDDLVTSDYLETLYDLITGTNHDFSACAAFRFVDGGEILLPDENWHIESYSNVDFLMRQLERKTEFGPWNKLFKKDIVDKLPFEKGKIHEDVIFSAHLAHEFKNGVIETTKPCYLYRQRTDGIVGTTSKKCSPDRVYAGRVLVEIAKHYSKELYDKCLWYAVDYPFMYVDPIYVHRTFSENREFLDSLQAIIKDYCVQYKETDSFSKIKKNRMLLFGKSRFLYGFNAYARLIRVFLYRIIRKDAYADGHGI